MDFNSDIYFDLERADSARAAGNEGRACVCARRAAGIAAQDFLTQHEVQPFIAAQRETRRTSVYEALQILAAFPDLDSDMKQATVYLTLRVTEKLVLPVNADFIAEARKLIGGLL